MHPFTSCVLPQRKMYSSFSYLLSFFSSFFQFSSLILLHYLLPAVPSPPPPSSPRSRTPRACYSLDRTISFSLLLPLNPELNLLHRFCLQCRHDWLDMERWQIHDFPHLSVANQITSILSVNFHIFLQNVSAQNKVKGVGLLVKCGLGAGFRFKDAPANLKSSAGILIKVSWWCIMFRFKEFSSVTEG